MSSPAEGDCPSTTTEQTKQRLPSEVWVLIASNAVIALGYGVVSPVLPQYARNFGVSISAATFVITAFAVMRLCFAPATGLLIQRLGERRVYVTGILIVAVTTGACAFAQTYWQLLLYRSLGGIGSTMFFVSALGLMIRISPEDARGRVAGMFSTSFLLGSVGGPVLGAATAGLGLGAPFIIYGVALMIAAAVVFFSLRNSSLAAPAQQTEPTVTVRVALQQKAYRAALLSNFAMGWSVFGLRMALVPLFVAEALDQGPGMAGLTLAVFAIGNVSAVFPSGYLSDRVGRRTLLIIGLSVSAVATAVVGFSTSLPRVPRGRVCGRRRVRHVQLAATGGGRRHHRQQGPRRHGRRDVSDDGRPRLDHRVTACRSGGPAHVVRLGVCGQRWHLAAGSGWLDVRAGNPRRAARGANAGARTGPGGRWRGAMTSCFERFPQVV